MPFGVGCLWKCSVTWNVDWMTVLKVCELCIALICVSSVTGIFILDTTSLMLYSCPIGPSYTSVDISNYFNGLPDLLPIFYIPIVLLQLVLCISYSILNWLERDLQSTVLHIHSPVYFKRPDPFPLQNCTPVFSIPTPCCLLYAFNWNQIPKSLIRIQFSPFLNIPKQVNALPLYYK